MTNDLVQFLRDRLEEDEQVARAWPSNQRGWEDRGPRYLTYAGSPAQQQVTAISVGGDGPLGWERVYVERDVAGLAEHIVRHDPARVLHEAKAKRAVVEEYEQAARYATTTWGQSNANQSRARTLRKVARLLALPYADHPDYRPEWAPDQA